MNLLIIFTAKYLFLASILIFVGFFLTLPRAVKKRFFVFTLASGLLAYSFAKILGAVFNDPRPFVSERIIPLVSHAADNGFPSDHTLLTMTLAAVVFVYNRRLGLALAGLSLVIGYSRVLAGIHHLIDIVGAIGIAVTAVVLVGFLISRIRVFGSSSLLRDKP